MGLWRIGKNVSILSGILGTVILDGLVNSGGKKNVRGEFFLPNYFAMSGNNWIKEFDFGGIVP